MVIPPWMGYGRFSTVMGRHSKAEFAKEFYARNALVQSFNLVQHNLNAYQKCHVAHQRRRLAQNSLYYRKRRRKRMSTNELKTSIEMPVVSHYLDSLDDEELSLCEKPAKISNRTDKTVKPPAESKLWIEIDPSKQQQSEPEYFLEKWLLE